jgi:hypothetical protein
LKQNVAPVRELERRNKMSYVHCHNCDWSQDDFYHEGYNPAKYLMSWNDFLFGKRHDRIDKQFSDDSNFVKENGPITAREVLARQYEEFAGRIRTMRWITHEDFINDPNKVCPKCKSDDLDID